MKTEKIITVREIEKEAIKFLKLAFKLKALHNIDMFVEYAPHCSLVNIRIYDKGWKKGMDVNYHGIFNIEQERIEDSVKEIKKIKKYVNNLLKKQ